MLDPASEFDKREPLQLTHAQRLERVVSEIVSDASLAAMEKLARLCEAFPAPSRKVQPTACPADASLPAARGSTARVCAECAQLLAAAICPRCNLAYATRNITK